MAKLVRLLTGEKSVIFHSVPVVQFLHFVLNSPLSLLVTVCPVHVILWGIYEVWALTSYVRLTVDPFSTWRLHVA